MQVASDVIYSHLLNTDYVLQVRNIIQTNQQNLFKEAEFIFRIIGRVLLAFLRDILFFLNLILNT